jgi:hypothetical protein
MASSLWVPGRSPHEIGFVVQARDPEHEADQAEEEENGHRDKPASQAMVGVNASTGRVPNDTVDVPMLAEPGANVAHESHKPGEGDRR